MYIYVHIESKCIVINFKITTDYIICVNHYAADHIKEHSRVTYLNLWALVIHISAGNRVILSSVNSLSSMQGTAFTWSSTYILSIPLPQSSNHNIGCGAREFATNQHDYKDR